MGIEAQIDGYAFGKLSELVESLFCDVRPAREKLLENYHMLFIIAPGDFKTERLQAEWASIQLMLKGKVKNYGSERIPQERITVKNGTLEQILRIIWNIYSDLQQDD
jgi:hypothetical protein